MSKKLVHKPGVGEYLDVLEHRGYNGWLETQNPEKAQRLRSSAARYKHGAHASAPLTCKGPGGCPFYDACPVPDKPGVVLSDVEYPIGMPCILEGEYMRARCAEYLLHLEVDPHNPVEMSIVQELAVIDLYKNRALLVLSHGDTQGGGRDFLLVDSTVTGYSQGGQPLVSTTTKLHPIAELIDRLERRREKWLDKLMQTRKSQADWAYKVGSHGTSSRIVEELSAMKEFIQNLGAREILLLDTDEGIDL
jgi:hypothetical protein